MFEKIEIFDKRYSELSERLYQPSVAGNPEEYQKIMKEIKSIEEIVLTYRKYKEAVQTEKDSLEILEETSDKELKELAQIELDEAKDNIKNLAEDLKILLLPRAKPQRLLSMCELCPDFRFRVLAEHGEHRFRT